MSHTNGIIRFPVNIKDDIGYVLGTGSGDLGINAKHSVIAPMAKYKPVRHSTVGVLTSTERANTRYGFGANIPTLSLLSATPSSMWTYLKPRGVNNNEYYRALDFDGYDHKACSPLALYVGQLVYDGQSQILVAADSMSNAFRTDNKTWITNHSLSLNELLKAPADYTGCYIALILIDTDDNNAKNFIVTRTTAAQLASSGLLEIHLYAQDTTDSGLVHPFVPLFAYARRNHTFRIIACLSSGNNPPSGYAYAVYASNLSLYTPYSLGFDLSCDRITAKLESGEFKMDGTQITSVTITATDAAYSITQDSLVWKAYSFSIYVVLSTVGVEYAGRTMNISGSIQVSNTQGYSIGPTPTEGESSFTIGIAALNLESNTSGQGRTVYRTGEGQYLWILYRNNGSTVQPTTVNVNVIFNYPFNNPISKQASKQIPS